MPNFKATQTSDSKALIEIYDTVGPDWAGLVSVKMVTRELKALKNVKEIDVMINSPGGSVWEGLSIYNLLNQHPAKVNVKIQGLAASVASLIAMAGDEIEIAQGAYLMIHNPWIMTMGEAKDLRETADLLDKIKQEGAQIYADRSKLKLEEIAKMMDDETWLTGKEAVEKGLATKLVKNKEANALMVSAKFEFKNIPSTVKVVDEEPPVATLPPQTDEQGERMVPEWQLKIEQKRREIAEFVAAHAN